MTMHLSWETEQILICAHREAVHLGAGQVGTEHLLLAILRRGNSRGGEFLARQGWTAAGLEILLDRGQGGMPIPQGLSPHAGEVLAGAALEAARLHREMVTPDHLLLSLLRHGHTRGARLLEENGSSLTCLFTDFILTLGRTRERPVERGGSMRQLEQFCEDMVDQAVLRDPVIGREEEIETVMAILSRKSKNNPALIGEPGVGKTAIVEGLAQRMAAGRVPESLQNKRLLSLDMASVLAGTKYRGEFEERIRDLVLEVRRLGNVILFVDEMHTLVGAGSAEGAIDAANLLKPALGRGEIQLIGATTLEEYRKHIEPDAALERRFRPVLVEEPSRTAALAMLEGICPGLERHHRVQISREAMEAAVDLSCRYLTEHFLPDKAVDLLDEAAAKVQGKKTWTGAREAHRKHLLEELNEAVCSGETAHAAALREQLQQLNRQQRGFFSKGTLGREDIAAVVSQRTGIPVGKVTQSDRERLLGLREALSREVLGQEEAVEQVAAAVCRGRLGLADSERPVASLLFLGPTGVGKTALCKALARQVYGSASAMIRLDMSEYMEQHAVSRLLGAPPGYVGHGEGGELTEPVRRKPYSVVLLDELEKAHREVAGILLQVLEDGVLTDSQGRHVNFKNTIVVMTSNLGSGRTGLDQVGFLGEAQAHPGQQALREFFSPEFLGRLDCVVEFQRLTQPVLTAIAWKQLRETQDRARLAGAQLLLAPETADCLAAACLRGTGGAREIRRRIRREIETPVAQKLLTARGTLRLRTEIDRGGVLVLET